jgi:hypothetical protein
MQSSAPAITNASGESILIMTLQIEGNDLNESTLKRTVRVPSTFAAR